MTRLHKMLLRHEGLRLRPYIDTVGKLTIGVGRNLDDVGITHQEALMLLNYDIIRVQSQVRKSYPWFKDLDSVRKDVVLDMVFNLGITRFRRFRNTIAAIKLKQWDIAALEMMDSKWATQVGYRAKRLSKMMKTGICNY